MKDNNDNVNVSVNVPNNNNSNNNNNDIGKYEQSLKAESLAYKLVEKFKAPDSFPFYCKVAYKLSESRIWQNYEKAQEGKNPAGLFNWLCRRDMR